MTDMTNDINTTNPAVTDGTVTIDEAPRYRKSFSNLLSTIRSLPPEKFAPVNLDVMSSVRTTEGVLPKIAGMRPLIAELLPKFPMELFDQLEDRALALGHAQTVFESTHQPPTILKSLTDEASKAHDIAHSEVTTLVHRGLIPPQALTTLNGGNGYRNLAADLFKLSEALRSNLSKISGRTSMTVTELDRLEHLADQINQALGIREQMPELQAAATRDRQAAYTLFLEAYEEVRSAIAYVRRREDDVDTLMPSLYAGRSNGKRKPAVSESTKPADTGTPNAHAHDVPVVPATPSPAAPAITGTSPEAPALNPAAPSVLANGPYMR